MFESEQQHSNVVYEPDSLAGPHDVGFGSGRSRANSLSLARPSSSIDNEQNYSTSFENEQGRAGGPVAPGTPSAPYKQAEVTQRATSSSNKEWNCVITFGDERGAGGDTSTTTSSSGTNLTRQSRSKQSYPSIHARQAEHEASHYRMRGCERMSDSTVRTISAILVASAILVPVLWLAVSNGDALTISVDQDAG